MSYQVLARKWRPQRFDEVVGQRGVTQTLRNALEKGRIAQAFVFAGPRGVGKTTTARILARALNCEKGPTAEPCGACEACREIAEGRDIDVLEIDAATHTQVDNVREVIIAGLGMKPVRDRYKIFIIDEVHQLSGHSFNALLKSIEEPPPHVVFMMATTELGKIPDTILSRSQVFEFRTIGVRAIADQLRTIADAEGISVDAGALALIARAAEGSMRDAESAFDQVIAFAGDRITTEDVASVLGLVGRDLLMDIAEAVANDDAATILERAAGAVESGQDLRVLCRELSRFVRDLMMISLDPARLDDPEIAAGADRDRLRTLAGRFSREDLMRAFDLLLKSEQEVRTASEPRYALEMSLLRWMHLRKLVPLTDLIAGVEKGGPPASSSGRPAAPERRPLSAAPPALKPASTPSTPSRPVAPASKPAAPARESAAPVTAAPKAVSTSAPPPANEVASPPSSSGPVDAAAFKDALIGEIKRTKSYLYNTVIAQAQRIQCEADRVIFTYGPAHRTMRTQLDQNVPWLEGVAEKLAGRKIKVTSAMAGGAAPETASDPAQANGEQSSTIAAADKKQALKQKALADEGVQAMLEVFGAEIRDVEEM